MSTRTNNPNQDRATLWTRVAARTAAVMVAAVAGSASFSHIASVAIAAGERTWVAYSLPLAIDGLIVVGAMALIEDRRLGRRPRGVARLAVATGVAATLAANIASADPSITARLVALAAPVAFLLSVEVLTRSGRPVSTPDDTKPTDQAEQGEPRPATDDNQPTAGSNDPAPVPAAATEQPAARRTRAKRRRPTAAQRVVKAVADDPEASSAQIAARLGLSERTVQRHWPDPPADKATEPASVDAVPDDPGPDAGPDVVSVDLFTAAGGQAGNGRGSVVPVLTGEVTR